MKAWGTSRSCKQLMTELDLKFFVDRGQRCFEQG